MSLLWLHAALLACRAHAPPALIPPAAPSPAPSPVQTAPPPPTGVVRDGVWADLQFPLSVRLPDGWREVHAPGGARAAFAHPSGAGLTVRADPAPARLPTHGDCTWDYEDRSQYRALRVTDAVRVASCVPEDPGAARRSVWILERDAIGYVFEAELPFGSALEGRPALEALLSNVRFVRGG